MLSRSYHPFRGSHIFNLLLLFLLEVHQQLCFSFQGVSPFLFGLSSLFSFFVCRVVYCFASISGLLWCCWCCLLLLLWCCLTSLWFVGRLGFALFRRWTTKG